MKLQIDLITFPIINQYVQSVCVCELFLILQGKHPHTYVWRKMFLSYTCELWLPPEDFSLDFLKFAVHYRHRAFVRGGKILVWRVFPHSSQDTMSNSKCYKQMRKDLCMYIPWLLCRCIRRKKFHSLKVNSCICHVEYSAILEIVLKQKSWCAGGHYCY